MKTGIIVAILVVAASVAAWSFRGGTTRGTPALHADEAYYTVKRGKLTVTITENGSLLAKNSEKVNFQGRRGSGKITFLIEEGKQVSAGDVLCRLDTKEMDNQVQQLQLEINRTEVDLNSAGTELQIQKGDNVANIEKAAIAVEKAEKELEKYKDGDVPKERRNLEVKIKTAETTYTRAKKKYEDSKTLLEQEYISKAQVDQDEIDYERSEIELQSAYNDLDLFLKYTLPMTLKEKQTAVNDAKRGLENAELRAASTLLQKEVTVKGHEERLDNQRRNLNEVTEEIDRFTIKSPSPGLVLHGNPQETWWRENLTLGGDVWGGMTLFTIPDLRVMQVQVNIHEADINKLKEDQPATVTMDTYPGLLLRGKVTKIAKVAGRQNRRGDDDVKKFTVEVTLDERADLQLKPGISAKTEIFIEERGDVLYVPRQAVFLEEGKHFCFVLRNGQPARTEVGIDISNDSFTQVASGLNEGERVLLYNPLLGPGGATEEKPAEEPTPAVPPKMPAGTPVAAGP
jgi:RND family efflux transporter MFP subunit